MSNTKKHQINNTDFQVLKNTWYIQLAAIVFSNDTLATCNVEFLFWRRGVLQLGGTLIAGPYPTLWLVARAAGIPGAAVSVQPWKETLDGGLAARAARDAERGGVLQLGRAQAGTQAPAQQPAAVHQVERKRAKHQACAGRSMTA